MGKYMLRRCSDLAKRASWGLAAVCAVALSACANDPNRVGTPSNPHKILVPAPSLEFAADEDSIAERKKVAKIEVIAPERGQHIVAQGVSIRINNGPSHNFAARFFLQESFEPVVRDLLAHRYDIDPTSNESVSVELLLTVSSRLSDDWLCKSWITKTRMAMNVIESKAGGEGSKKSYSGAGDDKVCPVVSNFSSSEDMEETINEAFLGVTEAFVGNKGVEVE